MLVSGLRLLALAILGCLSCSLGRAEPLPFTDREDGVSCSFFDVFLRVTWHNGAPFGLDVDGRINGPRAYATDRMEPGDTRRVRRLDVTALVRAWLGEKLPNDGLLLRVTAGEYSHFHARESADPALRPQLLLTYADGRERYLEPAADATLDCSTYLGVGARPTLTLHQRSAAALRFDLNRAKAGLAGSLKSAQLVLVRTSESRSTLLQLEVLAMQAPFRRIQAARDEEGIANRYPHDRGIDRDPDVLFADSFDSRVLDSRWKQGMRAPWALVQGDSSLGSESSQGRVLQVTVPKGQQVGLDLRYRFKDIHGSEPEEMYFRYQLRLARTWLGAVDGGKLPGFAGTYGQAGWGGRPWDGNKGWSMRGSHGTAPPQGHLAIGQVMLGTYAYHSGSGAAFGEIWPWPDSGWAGLIQADRWYSIEQRLRLNTPGQNNGLFEVWVDGKLALSRSGLRLRDRAEVRIEEVWMNFFHGGTALAAQDMHAYVDDVVVARRYIGPVKR
jgi:hypothetical protein